MKLLLSTIVYFVFLCFLPAVGNRNIDGVLYNQGTRGLYWTSTQTNNTNADFWDFYSDRSFLNPTANKANGFSVRCVK